MVASTAVLSDVKMAVQLAVTKVALKAVLTADSTA